MKKYIILMKQEEEKINEKRRKWDA